MTLAPALLVHHDGSAAYCSDAAPALGDTIRLRVRIADAFGAVARVRVRTNPDYEPRYFEAERVGAADGWSWWEAPFEVENPVQGYRFLIEPVSGRAQWLSALGLQVTEVPEIEDFRLSAYEGAPAWLAESVLYEVFPDRFARSQAADAHPVPDWAIPVAWDEPVSTARPETSLQFYGGDLDGVTEHLDHLVDLGVTLLYLNPFFPGRSNHRYDASSFAEVDPLLGGDAALVRLVEAAHARGLKVIGDLTSNHSGDGHEWFRAAHRNPGAVESDFYYWTDTSQEGYATWLGVESLPKFNWNSAELRRRFIEGPDSVVAQWLKAPFHLDGWRIDVANMTGRYRDEDLNAEVRRIIRQTMVEINPDTILLGESTNDAAPDFTGDAWQGAMTYANFTRPLWAWLSEPGSEVAGGIGIPYAEVPEYDGAEFYAQHARFAAAFPWRVRLGNMNALDTHDTPRFAGIARAGTVPVAVGLSMTLPGVPVVWAGDELGLTGIDGEHSRTPMPWATIAADPPASIDLYRELIALRHAHPALQHGGMRWLHADAEVVVFVREHAEESVLVAAARSDFAVELPGWLVAGVAQSEQLTGGASARLVDGALQVIGAGPSFTAWRLPGLTPPV